MPNCPKRARVFDDRRTFVGEFTPCDRLDDRARGGPCTLPGGHRGNCAP